MRIWEISPGLTFHFLFFCFFSPFSFAFPLLFFFLLLTSFLPPLGENYKRIYTPDSPLSCIIRLIPKFLNSFALAPLSIFFFPFPSFFFSFHSFCTLLFFSFSFLFSFPFSLPFPFPFLPTLFLLLFKSYLRLLFFPGPLRRGGGD